STLRSTGFGCCPNAAGANTAMRIRQAKIASERVIVSLVSLNLPLPLGEGRGEGLPPRQTLVLIFSPDQIQTIEGGVSCTLAASLAPHPGPLPRREGESANL